MFSRLPLLPESLSKDFSSAEERTRRAVCALYSVLGEPAASASFSSTYARWSRLFSVATEYGQPGEGAALENASRNFGLPTAGGDFGRLLFATDTFFAILAKLLALNIVTNQTSGSRSPDLEWALLGEDDFAKRFIELENGSLFRAAGLRDFLEDDVFGWYAEHLNPALLQALRATVTRLAEYDFSQIASAGEQNRDLLKAIYLQLVSPAVRKSLGEYYTPDWLARRLLGLLQEGAFPENIDTRVLDPACGSGTFLVLAIDAVQKLSAARLAKPEELLRKICRNIVGIDLNPLAVIAARTNYLLALGPLLRHRGSEALGIPVYLGDSIRLPSQSRRGEEANDNATTPNPPPYLVGSESSFDCVVGNPPWIGWECLPEDYRRATKDLWHQHGLFVHKGMDTILGKGKKDLSMLMTYVAAEHYLKEGGQLGFIITQAVFKMAGAGQGFRRFVTRSNTPLHCERVEDYSKLQLFDGTSTKTALFVMTKGKKQKYPIPYLIFRKAGLKSIRGRRQGTGRADSGVAPVLSATEWQAEPSDPGDPTSAWLTGSPLAMQAIKKVLGKSDYKAHQGVNTGGANAVYWFEIVADDGPDGIIARNLIGAAKRKIKSELVLLEKSRLFPLLRGQDVAAWQATPSAWLLFVQDTQTRRGIAENEMAKTPKTLRWLQQNQLLLSQRAAYKRFFKPETAPFWSMFDVGCYTFKPWKVVWPRIASQLQAAVVSSFEGKVILTQETFSSIGLDDEAEAFYVAGVVNSTPLRLAVTAFSQPGSKSFGTPGILERARIPRFDSAWPLHQAISAEAKRLSSGAPDAAAQMHMELDTLCRELWGLAETELRAVQCEYAAS